MSIYATNGDAQEQFASNKGWGDFCRWADEVSDPTLNQLCSYGMAEPASLIARMIRDSLDNVPPVDTVRKTAVMLLDFCEAIEKDDPVIITDGLSDDEGESGDA